MSELRPERFGRYLLIDKISSGGMAEVFLAKASGEAGFEKVLAIKRILPVVAEDADFRAMFVDEAQISARLNHPNIGQVLEFGEIGGTYFLSMEYVPGQDVRSLRLRMDHQRRYMPVSMAMHIISHVCQALDYAHRQTYADGRSMEIIHRDVSPPNVLVSYEGEVKLIDFGIAKAASRVTRTRAGKLKGKFAYMSPEQIDAGEIDHRSDIFSAGIVFYEMLTNKRPFEGKTQLDTLNAVRRDEPAPPSTINPDVPIEVDRIVQQALAKEPEQRYTWASELRADIERFFARTDSGFSSRDLNNWMRETFPDSIKAQQSLMKLAHDLRPDDFAEAIVPHALPPLAQRGPGPMSVSGELRAPPARAQDVSIDDELDDDDEPTEVPPPHFLAAAEAGALGAATGSFDAAAVARAAGEADDDMFPTGQHVPDASVADLSGRTDPGTQLPPALQAELDEEQAGRTAISDAPPPLIDDQDLEPDEEPEEISTAQWQAPATLDAATADGALAINDYGAAAGDDDDDDDGPPTQLQQRPQYSGDELLADLDDGSTDLEDGGATRIETAPPAGLRDDEVMLGAPPGAPPGTPPGPPPAALPQPAADGMMPSQHGMITPDSGERDEPPLNDPSLDEPSVIAPGAVTVAASVTTDREVSAAPPPRGANLATDSGFVERARGALAQLSSTQLIVLVAVATLVVVGIIVLAIFAGSGGSGDGGGSALAAGAATGSGPTGSLVVTTSPPADCSISIGKLKRLMPAGRSMSVPRLALGAHQVTLSCAGFKLYQRTVSIRPTQVTFVEAKLVRQ